MTRINFFTFNENLLYILFSSPFRNLSCFWQARDEPMLASDNDATLRNEKKREERRSMIVDRGIRKLSGVTFPIAAARMARILLRDLVSSSG